MYKNEISKIDDFLKESKLILEDLKLITKKCNSINYQIDSLNRTNEILKSIKKITTNESSLKSFEYPIGILLRSGLSDFIHNQYYFNKCLVKNLFDKDKYELEISEYLCGHFNRIDPALNGMEEYKEQIGIELLRLKANKNYKEISIIKNGKQTAKDKKLNFLEVAIENWEWYSKYEHYGFFTNKMLVKFEENQIRMNTSINLLFVNFYYCILTLCNIDSDLFDLEKAEEINKIILNSK